MPGNPAPPLRRAPDIADYLSKRPARAVSRRRALWEIEGGMQCSIIGTCLSDHDLIATIRKHDLRVDRGAQSYDIHSYCVRAAGQSSPFSRTLTKLLDRRFAGAVRLMGRASSEEEMRALWERLRDSGQIAAAYWAVMSHTHIPDPLKVSVFGEVHMLSHLNGHGANQLALRLAEAERKYADLETRLRRSEQAKLDALAERDAARAALAAASANAPAHAAGPVPHLREVASVRVASFLHHDGGIEDSLHRIEEMIEHCDAVVCPVDCVSHGACRMAKAACQRLNKRFLPIASASRSGFERALEELSRLGTDPRPAGDTGSAA